MSLTELELYNRRHEELMREAEDRRLARRLRQEHPGKVSEAKGRRRIGRLHRMAAFGEGPASRSSELSGWRTMDEWA
jgi:hypothetical protein